MESETILPCPFCGGECHAEQDGWDDDPWQVGCVGKDGAFHCGYRSHYGDDGQSSIAAHNAVASLPAEVAALRAENERLREDVARAHPRLRARVDHLNGTLERESDRLGTMRAQVAQLREAAGELQQVAAAQEWDRYGVPSNIPLARAITKVAAALAATEPGEEYTR